MKEPDLTLFTPMELEVLDFAREYHGEQKRKYTHEPYWFHLVAVATLVKEYGHDTDLVCGALLHDILEDTDCDEEDLSRFLTSIEDKYELHFPFEYLVIDYVGYLTDYFTKENFPLFNREQRKLAEASRLGAAVAYAQTIKYCDLIDNTASIAAHDPKFAATYLKEKALYLGKMTKGDPRLRERALLQLKIHQEI